jgi:exopolysaccharide production protein ExoZ
MPSPIPRVHALDALRGLLAIGIMVYHVLGWTHVASITTLGTYGVYAFFVLSGFALEWAYGDRLRDPGGLRRYAAARIGRILPLYSLAALTTAAMSLYARRPVDRSDLLLNVTLTFGFVNPGATSTVVGGWSIGIEVVFYALFPLIVWLRLPTRWLAALAVSALALRIVYVGSLAQTGAGFSQAWVGYSQMPSFLWFFVAGMLGSRLVAARDARRAAVTAIRAGIPESWPFAAGVGLIGLVVAATVIGDQRDKVVWPLGALLALTVAVAVVLAGHAPPWHGRPARIATLLGDLSYGTYLLHPIVWRALSFAHVGGRTAVVMTFVGAPLLALVVHRLIEVPAGRAIRSTLGRRPTPARVVPASPPADPA